MRSTLEQSLNDDFTKFANGYSVADFLEKFAAFPLKIDSFIECLAPLQPRLYSIASSPQKFSNDVYLLVSTAIYTAHDGTTRGGVASSFLNESLLIGETLCVFSVKTHFRLPEDPKTDVIFVGPGVGLAPFMGFLQEREWNHLCGISMGRSWLFFGDQRKATDFLFEKELEDLLQRKILTHLSVAFSRDQDHKIYVQHRIKENGEELWSWICGGAYIYVCGAAKPMASDVLQAFVEIAQRYGDMNAEEAQTYIQTLRREHRYFQDVY
jgi:sulfite reductase (NADPH) flavoprotein alpha-component